MSLQFIQGVLWTREQIREFRVLNPGNAYVDVETLFVLGPQLEHLTESEKDEFVKHLAFIYYKRLRAALNDYVLKDPRLFESDFQLIYDGRWVKNDPSTYCAGFYVNSIVSGHSFKHDDKTRQLMADLAEKGFLVIDSPIHVVPPEGLDVTPTDEHKFTRVFDNVCIQDLS